MRILRKNLPEKGRAPRVRLVRDRVRSCPQTPCRTPGLRQPRSAQDIPLRGRPVNHAVLPDMTWTLRSPAVPR
jgi:hypothetical protein